MACLNSNLNNFSLYLLDIIEIVLLVVNHILVNILQMLKQIIWYLFHGLNLGFVLLICSINQSNVGCLSFLVLSLVSWFLLMNGLVNYYNNQDNKKYSFLELCKNVILYIINHKKQVISSWIIFLCIGQVIRRLFKLTLHIAIDLPYILHISINFYIILISIPWLLYIGKLFSEINKENSSYYNITTHVKIYPKGIPNYSILHIECSMWKLLTITSSFCIFNFYIEPYLYNNFYVYINDICKHMFGYINNISNFIFAYINDISLLIFAYINDISIHIYGYINNITNVFLDFFLGKPYSLLLNYLEYNSIKYIRVINTEYIKCRGMPLNKYKWDMTDKSCFVVKSYGIKMSYNTCKPLSHSYIWQDIRENTYNTWHGLSTLQWIYISKQMNLFDEITRQTILQANKVLSNDECFQEKYSKLHNSEKFILAKLFIEKLHNFVYTSNKSNFSQEMVMYNTCKNGLSISDNNQSDYTLQMNNNSFNNYSNNNLPITNTNNNINTNPPVPNNNTAIGLNIAQYNAVDSTTENLHNLHNTTISHAQVTDKCCQYCQNCHEEDFIDIQTHHEETTNYCRSNRNLIWKVLKDVEEENSLDNVIIYLQSTNTFCTNITTELLHSTLISMNIISNYYVNLKSINLNLLWPFIPKYTPDLNNCVLDIYPWESGLFDTIQHECLNNIQDEDEDRLCFEGYKIVCSKAKQNNSLYVLLLHDGRITCKNLYRYPYLINGSIKIETVKNRLHINNYKRNIGTDLEGYSLAHWLVHLCKAYIQSKPAQILGELPPFSFKRETDVLYGDIKRYITADQQKSFANMVSINPTHFSPMINLHETQDGARLTDKSVIFSLRQGYHVMNALAAFSTNIHYTKGVFDVKVRKNK